MCQPRPLSHTGPSWAPASPARLQLGPSTVSGCFRIRAWSLGRAPPPLPPPLGPGPPSAAPHRPSASCLFTDRSPLSADSTHRKSGWEGPIPTPIYTGTEHKKPPFLAPGGPSLPRVHRPHGQDGGLRQDRQAASGVASRRPARGRAQPWPEGAAVVAMAEPAPGRHQVGQGRPWRAGRGESRASAPLRALWTAGTCGLSTEGLHSTSRGHRIMPPSVPSSPWPRAPAGGGTVWMPVWPARH